jgi:hypothetical protein
LQIGFIEGARVVHYHGQSERKSTPVEVWRKKVRAEHLFYRKHYRPETVARITRAESLKTRFRIITLQLSLPFMKNKGIAIEKLNKYKTIREELRFQKKIS